MIECDSKVHDLVEYRGFDTVPTYGIVTMDCTLLCWSLHIAQRLSWNSNAPREFNVHEVTQSEA